MKTDASVPSTVGAVLVVGGGIGGMQASLDLTESGIRVYLAEQNACIGGVMSQLDKTFPTNDCAMCTMAPRLVAVGRNKDIDIITLADLESIEGVPGNFTVRLKRRARYVDEGKCTGCGECMSRCPVRNQLQIPEPREEEPIAEATEVDNIIDKYGRERCHLIPILQEAHSYFNYLPEPVLRHISGRLNMPYAEVYGVTTFYKSFKLEPRGKHIIQVCMGTACHVRDASRVLEELERRLDIGAGGTTEDGMFTLETVNCLGACALGPVIVIDGKYYGQMTPRKVKAVLEEHQTALEDIEA